MKITTINNPINSIRTTILLCNPTVRKMLLANIALGICAALIEYLFAYSLQDFFQQLGIIKAETDVAFLKSANLKNSSLVLAVLGAVRLIGEASKIFFARLSQQIFSQDTRLKIVDLALNSSGTISTGKILSLFSDETNRASTAILNLSSMFTQLSVAICLSIFLISQFTSVFIISLFLLFLAYIPFRLFEKKISKSGLRLSESWEKTSTTLTNGIRNNFYLSLIGKVDHEIKEAKKSLEQYLIIYKKSFILISIKSAVPSFLALNILIFLAYINSTTKLIGDSFSFLTYFYLFLRFTQSLSIAFALLSEFKINNESTLRLSDCFNKNKISDEKKKSISRNDKFEKIESIELSSLTFSYDHQSLIQDLNIKITSGDILTIKGPSGSGKSTLLCLLFGILRPVFGKILINKKEVANLLQITQDQISYVGPIPYLVPGTIKENILYGLNEIPNLDQLINACKNAEIFDYIQALPYKFETRISEISTNISTGQKQRIMIARALLRNFSVLVMDEATANIDTNTENKILENLKKLLINKTWIIVTHRESFDGFANKTLSLEQT